MRLEEYYLMIYSVILYIILSMGAYKNEMRNCEK